MAPRILSGLPEAPARHRAQHRCLRHDVLHHWLGIGAVVFGLLSERIGRRYGMLCAAGAVTPRHAGMGLRRPCIWCWRSAPSSCRWASRAHGASSPCTSTNSPRPGSRPTAGLHLSDWNSSRRLDSDRRICPARPARLSLGADRVRVGCDHRPRTAIDFGRENHGKSFLRDDRAEDFCLKRKNLERETGIEPATNSLGSCDSTTELLPAALASRWRV